MSRAESGTCSDDGISSRRSLDCEKPAGLESMSCWAAQSTSGGAVYTHASVRPKCTPRLVMRGFPANVPSTGMPEKLPEAESQAVSAAAAWNAGAKYGAGGTWARWESR